MATTPASIWCVVANMTREPHPEGESHEMRLGTRFFAPGAKLYLYRPCWGDGGDRLCVLGRHRNGRRLTRAVVPTKLLTDWRPKQIFDPKVIRHLEDDWDDTEESKTKAETVAKRFLLRASRP